MFSKYSCIYKITTTCSDKVYIGSAVWFDGRVSAHINRLNANTHPNRHLQSAWNKYGADTFTFECIEECDKDKLIEREQFWIDFYDAANPLHGYNIAPIAGSSLGRHMSKETKQKIREKALGRKISDETRKKMSCAHMGENNAMYGKHHTESSKERIKYMSDGTPRSIAQSGKGNPFYGKHHTDSTKQAISKKRVGRRTRSYLTPKQVSEIKQIINTTGSNIKQKELFSKISDTYGVSSSCIRKIYRGERWSDIQ